MGSYRGVKQQLGRYCTLIAVLVVTAIWSPVVRTNHITEPSRDLDTYALFAFDSINSFKGGEDAFIKGGNVGANKVATTASEVTLSMAGQVEVLMDDPFHVAADQASLGKDTLDVYQVFANKTNSNFNAAASIRHDPKQAIPFAYAAPGFAVVPPSDIPPNPVCTPGTTDVIVQKGATVDLVPGAYKSVQIKDGGTLRLIGPNPQPDDPSTDDVYEFNQLIMGRATTLITEDDTIVRINTSMSISGENSFVGPSDAARFEICANNVSGNALGFGRAQPGTEAHGQFFVPTGQMNLGHSTRLFGRFWALNVASDRGVQITYRCPDCQELCPTPGPNDPVSAECPCLPNDPRSACCPNPPAANDPVTDACPCQPNDPRVACPCVPGDTRPQCQPECPSEPAPSDPVTEECPCQLNDPRVACPCVPGDTRPQCQELVCEECEKTTGGDPVVVLVDENVSINAAAGTCNDGSTDDLCDYFTGIDKTGGATADKWVATFDLGGKKLVVSPGVTVHTGLSPPAADRTPKAGIEIKTTCQIDIQAAGSQIGRIFIDTKLGPVGGISLLARGKINIDGHVIAQTRDSNYPGDVTVATCCDEIHVGPKGRVQALALNGQSQTPSTNGGGDVNLLACCEGGNIVIDGLVSAQAAEVNTPSGLGPVPDVNVLAVGGSVTINTQSNGNNPAPGYANYQPDSTVSRTYNIFPGVLSWVSLDNAAGSVNIQATGDITINGHGKPSGGTSFGAVAAGSSGKLSPVSPVGGDIEIRSLDGQVIANDRAVQSFGNLNSSAAINILARGNMSFTKVGGPAGFGPVVSSSGSTNNGGDNLIRSFDGSITITNNPTAPVLAIIAAGSGGTNTITADDGVTGNNATNVNPDDSDADDNVPTAAGPTAIWDSCAEVVPGLEFPPPLD
jgi:hypothetical protein